jgi:hypothetical protein
MFAVWAETGDTVRPTCPPLKDEVLQEMLLPTAWVRADWNANTTRWDIKCSEIDSIANMPASYPANAYNTMTNAATVAPTRRGTGSNSSYVNTNPYKPGPDTNIYTGPNANVRITAANSVPRPTPKPKRRPGE